MNKWLKRTLLGISGIEFIIVGVLFSRLETISSIKQVEEDLYSVDYHVDYKLDEVLEQGVSNVKELEDIVSKKIFFGYPIETNEHLFGYSAFAVTIPDGQQLVGRNFDYAKARAILVYTEPKGDYKSYSMTNLAHLGVSEETDTMPETLIGKLSILAAPYGSVDGVNEKGLSVSVLELQTEPTEQGTGKTNIITTVAVRMLLDKAATTQEAVALLEAYDMHPSAGMPYHLLIADASGEAVVVDWAKQKMNIVETNMATNFQLSPGKNFEVGIGHNRYATLKETLTDNKHTLDSNQAMNLLEAVKIEWNGEWQTEWSVVYNLSDFSVEIVNDMNNGNVHRFSKE
jgi:hypothetical protein